MTELFNKYDQAPFSSMFFHSVKERPESVSNLHRSSIADTHSASQSGMNGFQTSHGNMHVSEQFSHLSLFEDSRDPMSSSADHSLSSTSQTNSGDSWIIRPLSNGDYLHTEGTNNTPRLGNSHGDAHHPQEVFRSQRLAQQRRLMEEKAAYHLQMLGKAQGRTEYPDRNPMPLTGQLPGQLEYSKTTNMLASQHASQTSHSMNMAPLPSNNSSRMMYQVQFKRYVRFFTLPSTQSPTTPLPNVVRGDFVIVAADRGEDMGIVTAIMNMQEFIDRRLTMSAKSNIQEEDSIIGTILRVATLAERQQLPKKYRNEETVVKAARDLATNTYRLPLTITDADYQFDGHKLTVFYSSDARVDFRDYVRDLFSLFKTRIWMKKDPHHLMARSDRSGASFSLLGYVYDDNAAIALMTGMHTVMEAPAAAQPQAQPPRLTAYRGPTEHTRNQNQRLPMNHKLSSTKNQFAGRPQDWSPPLESYSAPQPSPRVVSHDIVQPHGIPHEARYLYSTSSSANSGSHGYNSKLPGHHSFGPSPTHQQFAVGAPRPSF